MEKQIKNKNILFVAIGLVVIAILIFIFSDEKKASDNNVVYNNQYEQKTNEVKQIDENIINDQTIKKEEKKEVKHEPKPAPHIEPSIKVLSPNGGEKIMLESNKKTYTIKWKTTGFSSSDTVNISLKDDSKYCPPGMVGCWTSFGIDSVPNTGRYTWDLSKKMFGDGGPNSMPVYVGDRFKIVLTVSTYNGGDMPFTLTDESDGEFRINPCPVYTFPPFLCTGKLVPRLDDNGCYLQPVCEPIPVTQ